jgi:hypothetical protein
MFFSKLPHWAFVAWVGLVLILTVIGQQFFELSAAIGWGLLTISTFGFYLLTIEQEKVRCEKAGWILMPGGVMAMLASWTDSQFFLVVVGMLALGYGVLLETAEHNRKVRQFVYRNRSSVGMLQEQEPGKP